MLNTHTAAVLQAQLRAIHVASTTDPDRHPMSATITALMKHGGLYTLLDPDITAARLGALSANGTGPSADFVPALQAAANSFFTRLVPNPPYWIPSSLMSHITLPHEGDAYTEDNDELDCPAKFESLDIPAAFTFVGQFIDHDLTMNAVDLFLPQQDPLPPATPGAFAPVGNTVQNSASPLIDLDSVYGPRAHLTSPDPALFEGGKFKMVTRNTDTHHFDLVRDPDGTPVIADRRNDENQLILQVHLLVERMHNRFYDELDAIADPDARFHEARRQTILNWQFMIVHDYLPRIIQTAVLADKIAQVQQPDFGTFRYKPLRDLRTNRLVVNLPHEFAIAFRFGHSQLRRAYQLNTTQPFTLLFDNRLPGTGPANTVFADLRGHQPLEAANLIDWTVFLPAQDPVRSNRIDGKVTARVFDLPESTIPDDILTVGNLPHRNLIRSRQVGLCSGEALAAFYGVPPLDEAQVEPNPARRDLYRRNEAVLNPADQVFATPLWYYVLREAEVSNGQGGDRSKLGTLGSALIAEVLLGAVAWADISLFAAPWTSTIPGPADDHLRNIVRWVNGLTNY